VEGKPIRARDIPKYCNQEFYEIFEMYQTTKLTGMWPNGSIGWANEPYGYVQAHLAFETEENTIQAEEMEKREKDAKVKAKQSGKRR
jgi:hypothetical protein